MMANYFKKKKKKKKEDLNWNKTLTFIKFKIMNRESMNDFFLGHTSDFSDNFFPNCFNRSGGEEWSISAPNIEIGILTSETMNLNIWDNMQPVTYI